MSSAIDRMRIERDQLIAERNAFDEFAKHVADLDPEKHTTRTEYGVRPPASGTGTTVNLVGHTIMPAQNAEQVPVSVIRDIYRETVMAVPHYKKEYGESINENLAAELGSGVAQTLTEADVLAPQIQAAVLNQAQQASKQRSHLLSHVKTEYEALIEARCQLRDLHKTVTAIEDNLYPRPVRELVQSWNRLETVADSCKTLLRERQTHLQTEHETRTMSTWSFQEYLFQPFRGRHPVLNDGLETLTRIRRAKRETVKAIYDW